MQGDGYSFLSCQIQNNGITATLYTLNILLFNTVESSAHDESTTLTLIAASIALGFALIEMMSSYSPEFHSDFRVAVCIWTLTTVVLLSAIVPVIVVVTQDSFYKSQNKTKVTIAKSEFYGTGRTSRRLGEQALMNSLSQRPVYKFKTLQKVQLIFAMPQTSDLIVWRTCKSGQLFWSQWYLGIVSSHSINGRKVWLSVASLRRTACFRLKEGSMPAVRGNRVSLQEMGNKKGRKGGIKLVEIEFQDNAQANSFVSELTESFLQIGVTPFS
ncbi:hypothetical protein BC830DRAFT_1084877 [Chytriomyces sp. MP71]|nr:hypothetical protein BC830DRAFT_1084877 [Chytriomyces sp. MP71]